MIANWDAISDNFWDTFEEMLIEKEAPEYRREIELEKGRCQSVLSVAEQRAININNKIVSVEYCNKQTGETIKIGESSIEIYDINNMNDQDYMKSLFPNKYLKEKRIGKG